jgi:hypothetical protein
MGQCVCGVRSAANAAVDGWVSMNDAGGQAQEGRWSTEGGCECRERLLMLSEALETSK